MEIILELVNPTLYEISHAENSLSLPPLAVCVCVCLSTTILLHNNSWISYCIYYFTHEFICLLYFALFFFFIVCLFVGSQTGHLRRILFCDVILPPIPPNKYIQTILVFCVRVILCRALRINWSPYKRVFPIENPNIKNTHKKTKKPILFLKKKSGVD